MAVDALSRVFSALADPTRRDLVARLSDGDASLTELAEPYDVSVQAVAKHLQGAHRGGTGRADRPRPSAARCTSKRRSST